MSAEQDPDPQSTIEAVSFHRYDRVVGELLRRRDIDSIPLLLARINDDTLVLLARQEMQPWRSWYDTPVRVKYKVRFVLERLLEPRDFAAMVKDVLAPVIDTEAAKRYFDEHRERIKRHLQMQPAPND